MGEVFGEARALEELVHPAIIRIRDCDFADASRSRPYLVMDYFDGENLESYVEKHGLLPSVDMMAVASQVADALRAAHARGILHRDVKPANVLVQREGASWRVMLIDFGLALRPDTLKEQPSSHSSSAKTTLGKSIAGTLHYAAPEQMGQLPGVPVGRHSDVYGFGRTCYYALLGDPEPDDVEREGLPDGWRRLLSRCTGRKLENRFADFSTVLAGLTGISQSPETLQPPGTSPPPAEPEGRVTIFGFSPRAILHWMGKEGWKFEDARKAIDALGAVNLKDSTVRTCLTVGRNPKSSNPAALTQEQAAKVHEAAGRTAEVRASTQVEVAESGSKDRFGSSLGSDYARINAVLTCTPKTVPALVKEACVTPKEFKNDDGRVALQMGTYYVHLKKLAEKGLVVKTADGYALPALGSEAPTAEAKAEQAPEDAYPVDATESAGEPDQGTKKTYDVTLQDIIEAGLLSPPLRLFKQYKGKLLEAKLLPQGKVEFQGQTFNTSSSAAEVARGTVIGGKPHTNGWSFWQYLDTAGNTATLADAREKLLAIKGRLPMSSSWQDEPNTPTAKTKATAAEVLAAWKNGGPPPTLNKPQILVLKTLDALGGQSGLTRRQIAERIEAEGVKLVEHRIANESYTYALLQGAGYIEEGGVAAEGAEKNVFRITPAGREAYAAALKANSEAARPTKEGLRVPQVKILRFLAQASSQASTFSRDQIALGITEKEGAKTAIGDALGPVDKEARERSDVANYPSLISLKLVEMVEMADPASGRTTIRYRITEAGREALKPAE